MLRRILRALAISIAPVWALTQVPRQITGVVAGSIHDAQLDVRMVSLIANFAVVVAWTALAIECVRQHRATRTGHARGSITERKWISRVSLWVLGVTTVACGAGNGHLAQQRPRAAVPVGDVLAPMVASSILTQVLSRRREQIRARQIPDRFTDDEMASLGRVVVAADRVPMANGRTMASPSDCEALLAAVERRSSEVEVGAHGGQWDVKVRVYGYPTVEGADGSAAEFRKKKALELLVWLVLNRDRTRRSAARTCLWEFAISDSTFSTVISDMRRALSGLAGAHTHQQWVPPTYSDVIPLSPSVVSDHDLLRQAHRLFLDDETKAAGLTNVIAEIRDVPFAGTNYLWADLDGTTTRLVISALDACRDLATWALEHDRKPELDVAVSAALRVMPGCEEFLEFQNLYLSNSYSYRRATRR